VKRLAPGKLTVVRDDLLQHDCTTLGGNSGSVVISLATGDAVGLHFGGNFHETNFAVPAPVVASLRDALPK
jgi:endonuclease G